MRIEHVAINIDDPGGWAEWYVRNCGFKVVRAMDGVPWTHFVADSHGAVLLEVYNRTDKPRLDWRSTDPILFHLALVSDDPETDALRLCTAGSTRIEGESDAEGFGLIMLRDPWGVPLQLCRRRDPFPLIAGGNVSPTG